MFDIIKAKLRLFASNTNVTGDSGLTAEMKTYYEKDLIHNAEPQLVHDRWGRKKSIPLHGGLSLEFRTFDPYPTVLTKLEEGVTPDGMKMTVKKIMSTVHQYGAYVEFSDLVKTSTIDDTLLYNNTLLSDQAGRTLDTVTREVLNAGTNVQYAEGQVASRSELTDKHLLTAKAVRLAVRNLKNANAKPIKGYWRAIIHPDISYDLKNDPGWRNPKEYADPKDIYTGEIGMLEGVRFYETTQAKIFDGAGALGQDVYSTLFFGDNAYAVTSIAGGALKQFIELPGSAGSADPLHQRGTIGWKAAKSAVILTQMFMLRVETGSTFGAAA